MKGTIFDTPFLVADGSAMIGLPNPSLAIVAPHMKSTWPPNPERKRVPTESDTTKQSSVTVNNNQRFSTLFQCS